MKKQIILLPLHVVIHFVQHKESCPEGAAKTQKQETENEKTNYNFAAACCNPLCTKPDLFSLLSSLGSKKKRCPNRSRKSKKKSDHDSDRREPPNFCIPDPGEPFVGIGGFWKPPARAGTQRNLFTDSPRWFP